MTDTAQTIFEMKFPFEYRGKTYIEFSMRRPKVRDLRNFLKAMEKDPSGALEKIVANLCEVDEPVIAEIDIEDFAPMKQWFSNFLKPMMDDSDE